MNLNKDPRMRFISKNKSTIMIRVPNTKQVCLHNSLMKQAMIIRDKICRKEGIDPYNAPKYRIFTKSTASKKNKELPVGVGIKKCSRNNKLVVGYYAIYSVNFKSKIKAFFFSKFESKEETLKETIKFRNEKEKELLYLLNKEKEFIKKYGFPSQCKLIKKQFEEYIKKASM